MISPNIGPVLGRRGKSKNKITGILSLAINILLAGGVMTVFHACAEKEDGTWMHCHYARINVAMRSI
jgi:hypothetical protein